MLDFIRLQIFYCVISIFKLPTTFLTTYNAPASCCTQINFGPPSTLPQRNLKTQFPALTIRWAVITTIFITWSYNNGMKTPPNSWWTRCYMWFSWHNSNRMSTRNGYRVRFWIHQRFVFECTDPTEGELNMTFLPWFKSTESLRKSNAIRQFHVSFDYLVPGAWILFSFLTGWCCGYKDFESDSTKR